MVRHDVSGYQKPLRHRAPVPVVPDDPVPDDLPGNEEEPSDDPAPHPDPV